MSRTSRNGANRMGHVRTRVGDHPESKGDPILMRGHNFAAVTWANRYGGARDKRAGLMMRMLGHIEIQGGWRYDAKSIPGVQNTLADGI